MKIKLLEILISFLRDGNLFWTLEMGNYLNIFEDKCVEIFKTY